MCLFFFFCVQILLLLCPKMVVVLAVGGGVIIFVAFSSSSSSSYFSVWCTYCCAGIVLDSLEVVPLPFKVSDKGGGVCGEHRSSISSECPGQGKEYPDSFFFISSRVFVSGLCSKKMLPIGRGSFCVTLNERYLR